MKSYCINIPRGAFTEAISTWDSIWKIKPGLVMKEHLDKLWNTLTTPFALEINSEEQTVSYSFAADKDTAQVLAAALYSTEPGSEIVEERDITRISSVCSYVSAVELESARITILPFNTFLTRELNPGGLINGALSRIPTNRKIIIQMVIQPQKDSAALQAKFFIQRAYWLLSWIWKPKYLFKYGVYQRVQSAVKEKIKERFYKTSFRIAVIHEEKSSRKITKEEEAQIQQELDDHIHALHTILAWVNKSECNKLVMKGQIQHGVEALVPFRKRQLKNPFLMTTTEIASQWHIPKQYIVPHAATVLSREASPPKLLPTDIKDNSISFFAKTVYRDQSVPFGMKSEDRSRHTLILGKSGVGKTALMKLFIKNDIDRGAGLTVLDTDGTLVDEMLTMVPKNRVQDVVILDFSETKYTPCFNPLTPINTKFLDHSAHQLFQAISQFTDEEWREDNQRLFVMIIKELMKIPGATIAELKQLLIEHSWYELAPKDLHNNQIMKAIFEKQKQSLLRLLSELFANGSIGSILKQAYNQYDFQHILYGKKIFFIKIPQRIFGQRVANILSSIVLNKISETVMLQSGARESEKGEFSLYIDNAPTFEAQALREMFSEMRKYGLRLTLSLQHFSQLDPLTQKALFGNVGNMIVFRSSADDAEILMQDFKSRIMTDDFMNLPDRECYVKMMVDGEVQEAFSARILDLPTNNSKNYSDECLRLSRKRYGMPTKERITPTGTELRLVA